MQQHHQHNAHDDVDCGEGGEYKSTSTRGKSLQSKTFQEEKGHSAVVSSGVVICVKDAHLTVKKTPAPNDLQVLQNYYLDLVRGVSITIKPGELCAVMGESGTGKSCLLDLMAGRKLEGFMSGQVLFNGEARAPGSTHRDTAYVMQGEVHSAVLTVHETLLYSARLRMDRRGTRVEEQRSRVDQIVSMLGLEHCRHTRIGDIFTRGISGGERKRLSIGVEIINLPHILFLDEATTGLDSELAHDVVSSVRTLADGGRTVVATIHQPSPEVFAMFDKVLLMGRGGRQLFFGSAEDLEEYFTSDLLGYRITEGVSLPEFALQVARGALAPHTGDTSKGLDEESPRSVEALEQCFRRSRYWKAGAELQPTTLTYPAIVGSSSPAGGGGGKKVTTTLSGAEEWGVGTIEAMWVLAHRSLVEGIRGGTELVTTLSVGTLNSLLAIFMFYSSFEDNEDGVYNRFNFFFNIIASNILTSVSAIPKFYPKQMEYERERASGAYGPLAFVMSIVVVLLLELLVVALVQSSIMYWSLGLRDSADSFFGFVVVLWLSHSITHFAGQWVLTWSPSEAVAITNLLMIISVFSATAGFNIRIQNLPSGWRWVSNISFVRYLFESSALNEFNGDDFLVDGRSSDEWLQDYDFQGGGHRRWKTFGISFGFLAGIILLTLIGLWSNRPSVQLFHTLEELREGVAAEHQADMKRLSTRLRRTLEPVLAGFFGAGGQGEWGKAGQQEEVDDHAAPSEDEKHVVVDGGIKGVVVVPCSPSSARDDHQQQHPHRGSEPESEPELVGAEESDGVAALGNVILEQEDEEEEDTSQREKGSGDAISILVPSPPPSATDDEGHQQHADMQQPGWDESDRVFNYVNGIEVVVRGLSYTVSNKRKKNKQDEDTVSLLTGVSFHLPKGGAFCAIMGASGAGKSTLLDALAGRHRTGQISGSILFDGEERSRFFHRFAAYVMQDDVHVEEFTMRQNLMYAARLRMPDPVTRAEVEARVDAVLNILELTECADSLVGNGLTNGVSGGERKRLSVGVELVALPELLFLDEPTSGLDAQISWDVMRVVRRLADRGRTIVTTIHQPSRDILNLFDHLLLLSFGRVVYFGSVAGAVPYFTSKPLMLPFRQDSNPADFFLRVSGMKVAPTLDENEEGQQSPKRPFSAEELEEIYKKSLSRKKMLGRMNTSLEFDRMNSSALTRDLSYGSSVYARSTWSQFYVLAQRTQQSMFSDRPLLASTAFQAVFTGLMQGSIYWQTSLTDPTNVMDRVIFMFLALLHISMSQIPLIAISVNERAMFVRERTAGAHGAGAFLSSQWLRLQWGMVVTLLYIVGIYTMIGLHWSWEAWWFFFALSVVMTVIGQACAQASAALCPSAEVATTVWMGFMFFHVSFSGAKVLLPTMSPVFSWLPYVSFLRWALQAAVLNDLGDSSDIVGGQTAEEWYEKYGFDNAGKWECLVYLVIYFCGLRTAAFLALKYKQFLG